MNKYFVKLFLILLLGCNTKQKVDFSSNCLEPDFKPVLITDIVHEIRPVFKDFGFKLEKTSDLGFVFLFLIGEMPLSFQTKEILNGRSHSTPNLFRKIRIESIN